MDRLAELYLRRLDLEIDLQEAEYEGYDTLRQIATRIAVIDSDIKKAAKWRSRGYRFARLVHAVMPKKVEHKPNAYPYE